MCCFQTHICGNIYQRQQKTDTLAPRVPITGSPQAPHSPRPTPGSTIEDPSAEWRLKPPGDMAQGP